MTFHSSFMLISIVFIAALVARGKAAGVFSSLRRELQETESMAPSCAPPPADGAWNTYREDTDCRSRNDCNLCEECSNNDDCGFPLQCHFREDNSVGVPGCHGDPADNTRYCHHPDGCYVEPVSDAPSPIPTPPIPTVSPTPAPTGTPSISSRPSVSADPTTFFRPDVDFNGEVVWVDECPAEGCPVCTGDCKDDSDCAGDLLCWKDNLDRHYNSNNIVPGCNEGIDDENHRWGHIGSASVGYCYDPWNNQTFPEQTRKTFSEWQAEGFYFNHDVDAPCCQVYAAYPSNANVSVPIFGSMNISDGSPTYANTTFIYVIDVSGSTAQTVGACGDATGEGWDGTILDCEVLSLKLANDDAIAGGQVDLVGLVNFSTTGAIMHELITPWEKSNLQHRDEDIIESLREVYPESFTNFSAGVELACDLAERPENDNQNTIIIFLADGLPNRGNSSQERIQNSCNGAVFRTYAVTNGAACNKIDPNAFNQVGDAPDTLNDIAAFSGGTCEYVPIATDLPAILAEIDQTKILSVHAEVNGTIWDGVSLSYSPLEPPFLGPGHTDYSGTIDLPVGVHDVCFVCTSEIAGVLDRIEHCRQIVVLGVEMSAESVVTAPLQQTTYLSTTLVLPDDTLIDSCCNVEQIPVTYTVSGGGPNDGVTIITNLDPNEQYNFTLDNDGTQFGIDYIDGCVGLETGEVCAQSDVFWQDMPSTMPSPSPSMTPSRSPSTSPSAAPSAGPSISIMPSVAPSSEPSASPSVSINPSGTPTFAPSESPSRSPSQSPSLEPSGTPTESPSESGKPSLEPSASPSMSVAPSSAPTASPSVSINPSTIPTFVPSDTPSHAPSGKPSIQPSSLPSMSPSYHPTPGPTNSPTFMPSAAPITPAPSSYPTKPPTNPSDVLGFGMIGVQPLTCNYDALPPNNCTLHPQPACRPLRFPAYCPPEESFLDLISSRHDAYTADPAAISEDGYWYPALDDKLVTKLFLSEAGFNVPELYYCSTDMLNGLSDFTPPAGTSSFVVKALGLHSDAGIFVLPNGFGGTELLTDQVMTMADVQNALGVSGATEFIVEAYIGDPVSLSDEYKFQMFNETVGSIVYSTNRGSECECFSELDADWNRVDTHGCVRPGDHTEFQDGTTCPVLNTRRGLTVQMKSQDICTNAPPPEPAIFDALTTTAQQVSNLVGVYMRVDMYVDAQGNVVVGELTPNHTNGRVHCTVVWNKYEACYDPCHLGGLWAENSPNTATGLLHGGEATPIPDVFTTVGTEFEDMCTYLIASS